MSSKKILPITTDQEPRSRDAMAGAAIYTTVNNPIQRKAFELDLEAGRVEGGGGGVHGGEDHRGGKSARKDDGGGRSARKDETGSKSVRGRSIYSPKEAVMDIIIKATSPVAEAVQELGEQALELGEQAIEMGEKIIEAREKALEEEEEVEEEEVLTVQSVHDFLILKNENLELSLTGIGILLLQCGLLTAMTHQLTRDPCHPSTLDVKAMWTYGIPLCCIYAGATLVDDFSRALKFLDYTIFRDIWDFWTGGNRWRAFMNFCQKIWKLLLSIVMAGMLTYSFIIVARIMGTSEDLESLISNFIGIEVVLHADELMAEIMREPLGKDNKDFYKLKNWSGRPPETAQERKRLLRHFRLLKLGLTGAIAIGLYVYAWEYFPNQVCPSG